MTTFDLDSLKAGPKPTLTLSRRREPLAAAAYQLQVLHQLELSNLAHGADFDATIAEHGWSELSPAELEIFQINIGKLCNMTCQHCHVDSGPDRTKENMDREMIDLCLAALDKTNAHTVDLTGGAPELNPHFRYLVDECVKRGKHVIDRCNLTVLLLPGKTDLPEWFAERGVEIVCSLPHYRRMNTDKQRGKGTYEKSIEALEKLNAAGYGKGDPKRQLTLMSNPVGAFLSSGQAKLEQEWKDGLLKHQGVTFDRLITLNNMPISRYLEWLEKSDNLQGYMELLVNSFNPGTVAGLMCRNTISVSWDGSLYDCDFNQMLEMPVASKMHLRDFDPQKLAQRRIATDRHCFGCTAGAGSSCGGSIEEA
ncbi:arsenosugar biosynthesis radical SAM protein ArsS [filamentous cyanobacterium LEGE 11480]|uniref:Arsenosugar biosynthesis radical SAM protein ArsS n=1 Tax=Romeriopsis navalis LEGE 11480 TaxID=2777977 RepID=A0A928VNH5_9CYAN|nr:arsenosugar biosynthesis radical SAM (seleno)protein ArsS [Romeriopsis navalis]MBE9030852.1 arsenosugar biosynthesis radical SAM protein ArsS [Romeriopsis navalis LEGE 11480]